MLRSYVRIIVFPMVLTALGIAPASLAEAQQLLKARLAFPVNSVAFSSYKIALNKGFYKKEGLDLEAIRMSGGLSIKAMVGGSMDFSASTGALNAAARGLKIKVIATLADKSAMDVITRPDIKTAADLKGKKLAITGFGGLTELVARQWLTNNGLEPMKDVILVAMGDQAKVVQSLKAKAVDAGLLSPPHNFVAMEAGLRNLGWTGKSVKTISGVFSTTEKNIKENPKKVYAFVKGTLKGHLTFINRKDISMPIIMKWLNLERAVAEKALEAQIRISTKNGRVAGELMRFTADSVQKRLKLTTSVKPSQLFDYSFIDKALKEIKAEGWTPKRGE